MWGFKSQQFVVLSELVLAAGAIKGLEDYTEVIMLYECCPRLHLPFKWWEEKQSRNSYVPDEFAVGWVGENLNKKAWCSEVLGKTFCFAGPQGKMILTSAMC